MKQYVFLINRNAGKKVCGRLPRVIEHFGKLYNQSFSIEYTENESDAIEKTKNAVETHAFAVIAAGGDGTANIVARSLLHTKTRLGIIPTGSGNGLARHLGIPLSMDFAVENIFNGKDILIDTGRLNNHLFLSNAGFGFLAQVIHSFHGSRVRGFFSYAWHTARCFLNSKNVSFKIVIDGCSFEGEFLLMSACNANQFGYNIKLIPDSNLQDGMLEFYLVKKTFVLNKIMLLIKVFKGKAERFSDANLLRSQSAELFFNERVIAQIDGDPIEVENYAHIQVLPQSLCIIVPQ